MTTPQLPQLPSMLGPFREAIDFQRERFPTDAATYETLDRETRLRAITMAGLTKLAAYESLAQLAYESTRDGLAPTEFRDRLASIIEENGGTLLPPHRLDLVFRNNNALAASAGRYRQIIASGLAQRRPYGQYPLGPNDASTSAICRRLQGLVFPLVSALARRIWPPNHHGERHISVTTLTEAQAKASGRLYQGDSNDEYPFLEDPETGSPARVMPDPGFDFEPALLAADGKALARSADELRQELPAGRATDHALAPLTTVFPAELPRVPKLRRRIGDSEENRWRAFREALGFAPEETVTMLADFAGEGVIATRESFERAEISPAYFPAIAATIASPFEAWLIPFVSGERVRLVRRYIGLFADDGQVIAVVVDRSADAWLLRVRAAVGGELAEDERRGYLTSTRSAKKGIH